MTGPRLARIDSEKRELAMRFASRAETNRVGMIALIGNFIVEGVGK